MRELVRIDGSYGEGGGQVLRTCLSLSAITGRLIEIENIRGGRAKPGLQAQHLASVRAAGQICGATISGDAVGSLELVFQPQHLPIAGNYVFDIGTAGSTTLVAQTVIVPLALAGGDSSVTIRGGTHNPMAPTVDYLEQVYAAMLRSSGYPVRTEYGPPGFFPRGGGELRVHIGSSERRLPFVLEAQQPHPKAWVVASGLPEHVSHRAENLLKESMDVDRRCERGPSTGAAVTITAGHAGFSSLGERGKPMEQVTQEAIDGFSRWQATEATVDEHLADQLVLPALFCAGESRWRTPEVTEHQRTVLWVASKFFDLDLSLSEDSGQIVLKGGHDATGG